MKFTPATIPLLVAASAILAQSASAALLAHYSFDSNFTDGSGNANHLTASSGTPNVTTTTGQHVFGGGAANLDQSGTQEHLALTATIDDCLPIRLIRRTRRLFVRRAAVFAFLLKNP
jgi:hypothetical protein